jgi:acyl carrier protein
MEIFSEIKAILVKELALDEEAVVPEAHLQDDLGADSLAILNLTERIGIRYGIEITGDDLVEINDVGGLVQLIESRISSKL